MTEAPTQDEVRLYLHAMAGELAKVAKENQLDVLARLFYMAEHEAAGLGRVDVRDTYDVPMVLKPRGRRKPRK